MVVKIEFTVPLSHSADRKIFPFKKCFKKIQRAYLASPVSDINGYNDTKECFKPSK